MRHDGHVRSFHGAPTYSKLRLAGAVLIVLAAVGVYLALGISSKDDSRWRTLRTPIDPAQQTALAFGERSHWLQPWRAYLDTPPATRLRDAIGINFNVDPREADATAALLQRSGFRRARIEISWDQIRLNDPDRLRADSTLPALVGALKSHGIRPLILLNANHNGPGLARFFTAELAQPAAKGARQVRLTQATVRHVEQGHSGLNRADGKAADVLFTSLGADGTATLSKPLPEPLAAGPHEAATLRYLPFGPPRLEDGSPNPEFERTLDGWLRYVRAVVSATRSTMGSQDFDVEVWNELSFGSDFLYADRYYDPPRERGTGDVTKEILSRTVSMLRGPDSPAPRVGISDGFASQSPFPAPATAPSGITALSKHPYYSLRRFPDDAVFDAITPLDARGRPSFKGQEKNGQPVRRDRFVPDYTAFFPEYILTGIQTESMIRDLSPITSDVNGTPHGRKTHPPGGPAPQVWITEANLDPTGADASSPGAVGSGPGERLAEPDRLRLQAKAALRYYTAFANKGVSAIDLFAAKDPSLGLIDPRFFTNLSGSGGPTPVAVGRLARTLSGAQSPGRTRPLSLLAISEKGGDDQFKGDGTAGHRALTDRDVTAFFPFEVRPGRYVAAAYVMTRDLSQPYSERPFRFTIGNLDSKRLKVGAVDPMTGRPVHVSIVRRGGHRATIELPLTDYPRMITLDER
jgi:hypothetical protein